MMGLHLPLLLHMLLVPKDLRVIFHHQMHVILVPLFVYELKGVCVLGGGGSLSRSLLHLYALVLVLGRP